MKKPTSIKELCEFIWYIEEKYSLLGFKIDGVKPWQAYRLEIYYELGRRCGVFDKQLKRGVSLFQKIALIKELIFNTFFHHSLKNLYPVQYLVFSHPRSKFVDNKYIDIYTEYFIQELLSDKKSFLEFEGHYNLKHLRKYKSYKRYLDFITLWRNIKAKFIKISLSENQHKTLQDITKEINTILEINYDLEDVLIQRTRTFIPTYQTYFKILNKTRPEKIFIVVSYDRPELIQAAKELQIEVIELQHGTFSEYHLGYSFPNHNSLSYFPDRFYAWNNAWKEQIDWPIKKENVTIYPYRYMELKKEHYPLDKKSDQAIVLCQAGMTDKIAERILENFERFQDLTLIFKLHPNEYGRAKLYPYLTLLMQKKLDTTIVEDIDLYALLAESEYQIGVFSTALYEGVEFQCKTILLDLPGIEYMKNFTKAYKVDII